MEIVWSMYGEKRKKEENTNNLIILHQWHLNHDNYYFCFYDNTKTKCSLCSVSYVCDAFDPFCGLLLGAARAAMAIFSCRIGSVH